MACRVPDVWDAIVRDISVRNVVSRRIQTLITRDDGMGAKQIVSYEPGTSGIETLSSATDPR
jgi:hypothetical protein